MAELLPCSPGTQRADLADTVLAQGGCQLTALVQIAVQQHHMGLLLDQRCGQRRTNAAGRVLRIPVATIQSELGVDGLAPSELLRRELLPAIEALRIGVSTDAEAHYGPVVTAAHKAKVEGWIQTAIDEGSELVVDGRGFKLQGHENGYFVGPTLLDHVTTDMESYKEEIFGPVLQIVRAANFEEALALPTKHQYGNGVAINVRNAARISGIKIAGLQAWDPKASSYEALANKIKSAGIISRLRTMTSRSPAGSAPDQANRPSGEPI